MRILVNVILTAGIWLAGAMLLATDGQFFRHALIVFSSSALGSVPWLPLLSRRNNPSRRYAALVIVGVSAILAMIALIEMPGAYEAQRSFNSRKLPLSTPNQGSEAGETTR